MLSLGWLTSPSLTDVQLESIVSLAGAIASYLSFYKPNCFIEVDVGMLTRLYRASLGGSATTANAHINFLDHILKELEKFLLMGGSYLGFGPLLTQIIYIDLSRLDALPSTITMATTIEHIKRPLPTPSQQAQLSKK